MSGFYPIGVIAALRDEIRSVSARHTEDIVTVQSGLGGPRVQAATRQLVENNIASILVWGTCGALDPEYRTGDIVLYSEVVNERGERFKPDQAFAGHLADRLRGLGPRNAIGITTTVPITDVATKRALREKHHADCVDMESADILAVATAEKIPCAIVRSVVDTADKRIPSSAIAGMQADGSTRIRATIAALLKSPSDIPRIVGLANDYRHALAALSSAGRLIHRG